MKAIINGKKYDTETAAQIASYSNTGDRGDFRFVSEKLYKTDNGSYFIAGEGGPMTSYAKSGGSGSTTGSSEIRPKSPQAALEWCEDHNKVSETILEEFDELIEEA